MKNLKPKVFYWEPRSMPTFKEFLEIMSRNRKSTIILNPKRTWFEKVMSKGTQMLVFDEYTKLKNNEHV